MWILFSHPTKQTFVGGNKDIFAVSPLASKLCPERVLSVSWEPVIFGESGIDYSEVSGDSQKERPDLPSPTFAVLI